MHALSSLSQWQDLPQDVLREISGRLHDPADYVHFHAVCKPWRDTAAGMRTTNQSPWLLAPEMMLSNFLELRCVFSKTSYRALTPFSIRRRNWVTSADGTAVRYFAPGPSPSLRDPLTGAITLLLPPLPHENGWWCKGSPNGIVCSDGTVLLYTVSSNRDKANFRATILRPGDTAWTVVERTFGSPHLYEFNIVYHRGKIIIPVHKPVITPPNVEVGDVDVITMPGPRMPGEHNYNFYVHRYVLESRGELLCVSIHVRPDYPNAFGGKGCVPSLLRTLSVYVHKLEENALGPGKLWWVSKDRRCLADRVLFLGWPNSFAVDASRLNGDVLIGGCAYFVYHNADTMPNQPGYVFRYNLIDNKAKFVEQLPEGWDIDMFTWLFPQPSIAPVQEISERLEGRQWWKKKKRHMAPTPRSNIYIERPQPKCYNPYFRVSVRNLPRRVECFQLKKLFRKYGKVSSAKVMCKKKNKMSKKNGLVTIAMVEEQAEALAALDGLVLNGCILEVRLVRRWKGRRLPPTVPNQHNTDNLTYIDVLLLLFVITVLWNLAYLIW